MLIVAMIGLVATCLLISNWLSYIEIRDATITNVNTTTQRIVRYEAQKIEDWFSSKATVVDKFANGYISGIYQDNFVAVARLIKATGGVTEVTIGFDDGRAYSSLVGSAWVDGVANIEKYNPTKRPWYSQAKTSQVTDVTEIYKDSTTGNDVISIMKGMGDGVALIDLELTILEDTIREINYPGAITVITDGAGKVMASNSQVVVAGTRFRDFGMAAIEQTMLRRDQMMLDYALKGVEKIAFTKAIELVNGNQWFLFIGVDKSVAYAELEVALTRAVVSSLVMMAIAIVVLLAVLQWLYRPILLLKEVVLDLGQGNGDLTRRLPVESNDDLGQISEGINQFISKLQAMMLEVLQSSTHISASVELLQQEVDANSQILIQHTTETDQIVAAVEEMSATARDVAQNGNDTASFTQTTNTQALESKAAVAEATATVARLVSEVEHTATNIVEIENNTTDITNVLKVIGDIADQTNLLALNAAIEAARAGEFGRGFAVVADEVRALAAKTQASTTEIEQTLAKLRGGSSAAINAMALTKATCLQTVTTTEVVAERLDDISDSVSKINDLNTQIATAAEEQSCVADEITRNMTAISTMASELMLNGENSSIQTINLASANSQLKSVVSQFKLS